MGISLKTKNYSIDAAGKITSFSSPTERSTECRPKAHSVQTSVVPLGLHRKGVLYFAPSLRTLTRGMSLKTMSQVGVVVLNKNLCIVGRLFSSPKSICILTTGNEFNCSPQMHSAPYC